MKQVFVLLSIIFFLSPDYAQAQPGKRLNAQEKTEKVLQAFESAAHPDKKVKDSLQNIFIDFYTGQDRLREDIQKPKSSLIQSYNNSPAPSFQNARKQKEVLEKTRDERLKKLLSAEDFKKWTTEIEPTLKFK